MVTLDRKQFYAPRAPLLGEGGVRKIVLCAMGDVLPFGKAWIYRRLRRRDTMQVPRDGAHIGFAELVANDGGFTPAAVEPTRDLAVLKYTGGTTGAPKAAMLTHQNLTANTLQCLRWFPGMEPGRERALAVLPFFHVFAMTVAMNLSIASGAEIVLLPRFEIKSLLAAIRRKRPTTMPGVPTLFTAVCAQAAARHVDLTSIKSSISGRPRLATELKSTFEAATRCTLVDGYSLSETSPVVACNPLHRVNTSCSVVL